MLSGNEKIFDKYSVKQIDMLVRHLEKRIALKQANKFNVIFDLLHKCTLNCIGCGTNSNIGNSMEKTLQASEIENVLLKIKDYADSHGNKVFINFGGGEPFLRDDIIEILSISSKLFGEDNIGIDTNGTLPNLYSTLTVVLPKISYLGISINGLEKYHNWWSGGGEINSFKMAISFLKKIIEIPTAIDKIEVTSVATKDNLADILQLIPLLTEIGVKNYSVHRAIPVGRMRNYFDLIPNKEEYLDLYIKMLERKAEINSDISLHLHNSLESIYASFLKDKFTGISDCQIENYSSKSIGVDPSGNLGFSPWSVTDVWSIFNTGNLFLSNNLNIISDSLYFFQNIKPDSSKCDCCERCCSGGNRLVASIYQLQKLGIYHDINLNRKQILNTFNAIDPACPLYD